MFPTIRTLGSIAFMFLIVPILSFFVGYLDTPRTQHKDAVAHSTPTFTPDDKTVLSVNNFHGPVTIHHHHRHPEPAEYPSFPTELLSIAVFAAFCLFGILWATFILWLRVDYARQIEPPATRPGRTPPIVSGAQLSSSDDSDRPAASPSSDLGTTTNARVPRGRQFPSQDLGSSLTLLSCRVKEPGGFSGKDQMQSLTSVAKHLEGSDGPVGHECKSTVGSRVAGPTLSSSPRALHHPVQAPPLPQARTSAQALGLCDSIASSRPKPVKPKVRTRLITYRGFSAFDVRHRHRGSTPGTVEMRQVERKSSLEVTLYGNPRILQPVPIVWFILIVAVDYGSSQDPKHDLEFWKKVLKDPALVSENIHFAELAGKDATPESIKKALTQLWHESGTLRTIGRSNLFVYLTGEGDSQNRMCLLDEAFISEADIGRWLQELRATSGYAQPITFVLDICRINKDKPSAIMDRGVELICSSSPGEQALALRFNSNQDTPYSSFILAFLIASFISPVCTSGDFVAAVEQNLEQLTGLIQEAAQAHGNEDPGPQKPDWSQANDLSTFLELARMVSRTTVMREVYYFVTQLPYFREKVGLSNSRFMGLQYELIGFAIRTPRLAQLPTMVPCPKDKCAVTTGV